MSARGEGASELLLVPRNVHIWVSFGLGGPPGGRSATGVGGSWLREADVYRVIVGPFEFGAHTAGPVLDGCGGRCCEDPRKGTCRMQ